MPRTLWKGAISFGLVHIPVNLYPAEKRHELSFSMLDRRNMKPVGYQRINKESGEVVPWEEIVKGYEYEKDHYVVLSEEDFRRANVEATQTIDILNFVDPQQVASIFFESPYYLAPGRRGEKSYALLRETLKRANKIGIANVVIRTKQYLAALLPSDDVIVLNTLRYSNEIRAVSDLELPDKNLKSLGVNPREIEMALRLVEEMSENWRPEKYHNTYRDDILALVEKKVNAGKTETITQADTESEEPRKAEVIDLMALLKRSVEGKGKKIPRPNKATHTKTEKQEKRKRA